MRDNNAILLVPSAGPREIQEGNVNAMLRKTFRGEQRTPCSSNHIRINCWHLHLIMAVFLKEADRDIWSGDRAQEKLK